MNYHRGNFLGTIIDIFLLTLVIIRLCLCFLDNAVLNMLHKLKNISINIVCVIFYKDRFVVLNFETGLEPNFY